MRVKEAVVVLAAAQDVGGANVLVPIIRELRARHGVRVETVASSEAQRLFVREGISHRKINFEGGGKRVGDQVRETLEQVSPDAMLLGTSWGPSLEKTLLSLGKGKGIPSLSVVDMWSNYRERFVDPITGNLQLPSKVAVMDEWAFAQAREAGLPDDVLVVTGQPYLDALADRLHDADLSNHAEALRRGWLRDGTRREDGHIVLFAADWHSRDLDRDEVISSADAEVEALEALGRAVERCKEVVSVPIVIVVKLHPRLSPGGFFPGPLASRRLVRVVSDEPPWPCILAADVVVGMTSMLLIESFVAGKATISFQPDPRRQSSFVGSHLRLIPTVSSCPELAGLLRSCLTERSESARGNGMERKGKLASLIRGDAAFRCAEVLWDLICPSPGRGPVAARG